MRILLADDERDFVETLAERLALRGHTVRVVLDGPSALAVLEESQPDVLVLDWFMPGMSGLDVLERVSVIYPALPVILLTGHGQMEDGDDIPQAQARIVLTKPLRFETFLEILEDAVHGTFQRQGGDS